MYLQKKKKTFKKICFRFSNIPKILEMFLLGSCLLTDFQVGRIMKFLFATDYQLFWIIGFKLNGILRLKWHVEYFVFINIPRQ
jgi:hypothetical protein